MTQFATYPSLRDRTVLVTGGASGIGADIVRAFDGQGARVAFLDIQDEAGAALSEDLGGRPLYLHADVTDIAALRAAIAEAANRLGPVRVLVNNAANDRREAVDAVTPEDWDRAQAVNLRPHFFAAQAVREGMRDAGGGSIINFSSIAWRRGMRELPSYSAAKAAIVGLTYSLADALGGDDIRVNAIEPGAVITPRQRELWYPTEADVQALVEQQKIKRVLAGEDVARLVLFLASDDARMITKQSYVIDAGML